MNAIPTSGPVGEIQLLTWARFADLRDSKSFRCIRLGIPGDGDRRFRAIVIAIPG